MLSYLATVDLSDVHVEIWQILAAWMLIGTLMGCVALALLWVRTCEPGMVESDLERGHSVEDIPGGFSNREGYTRDSYPFMDLVIYSVPIGDVSLKFIINTVFQVDPASPIHNCARQCAVAGANLLYMDDRSLCDPPPGAVEKGPQRRFVAQPK
ncbi:unnamed protein product [Nippostrongylus brasiliensis]|uniref:ZP domain-containing protein n=1 Tax=Nippostrongylus brasiliensis TaxID=27835 RepID=A0A158QZR9_NIPBR|nr:unnamed protein product [Nippostrongylus brasiliensis]